MTKQDLRIVFMGTPDFAVESFKAELPLPKVTGRFIRFTEEDY